MTRYRLPTLRMLWLWFVAMAAQMVLWFPWHPQVLTPGLDSSYFYALNELFAKGVQFADIVHNHGPYGFLKNQVYHPDTFRLLVAARIAMFAVFSLLAARLAARWAPSTRSGALWIVLLVVVARYGEAYFFALAVLAYLVFWSAVDSQDRARWAPVALALSLVCLMKITYLVMVLAMVALMALAVGLELATGWPRERRTGAPARFAVASAWPVLLIVGVLLLWVGAGQNAARIGEFIAGGLHFSAEFGESHARAGPTYQVVAFAAAGALFWIVFAAREVRRSGIRAAGPAIALGLWLALTAKYAFVRHDAAHAGHGAFLGLTMTAVFGLMMLRPSGAWEGEGPGRRAVAWTAVAAMVTASLLLITYDRYHWYGGRFFRHLDLRYHPVRIARFFTEPSRTRARHDRALAAVRKRFPLPPIDGTVDVYPWELSIAFAHGLPLDSRPSVVSQVVDDPQVAAANARHLADSSGPETVIFQVNTIDHRFPSMDDGLSWPIVLTDFRLRAVSGGQLVLRRGAGRRGQHWGPPLVRELAFGERMAVVHDPNRMLWLRVDPVRTGRGRLTASLARGPILYLRVELSDGGERWFRLVPGSARAGFLLSPLVEDNASFRALLEGSWPRELASRRVRALAVETEFGAGWYWEDTVRIELQELSVR